MCCSVMGGSLMITARVLNYYASSNTPVHVAETDINTLPDYAVNKPPDAFNSAGSVRQ